MKHVNLFLLLSFCCISNIMANVTPRYKAHVFLKYVVFNGDSLLPNGLHDVEIPFYEESTMTVFASGKDGEMASKMLGRPVWRSGKIDHHFMIQFYFRKISSDKWEFINEIKLSEWHTPYTLPELLRSKYEFKNWNALGAFEYRFMVKVELLQENYTVEEDSTLLTIFNMNIKKMRVDGKKVKLSDSHFESKYKKRGEMALGKLNKKPVSILYEINRGTARTIGEYEVVLYYTYWDKKSGMQKKQYLSTQTFNISKQPGFETYQSTNNFGLETVFIEYNVKVYKQN